MKPKKKNKANLERSRFIFFEIGTIISLSLILAAFSWSSKPKEIDNEMLSTNFFSAQEEMLSIPRKEEIKPEKKLLIKTFINIVENDEIVIDEPDFSNIENRENNFWDMPVPDYDPEPESEVIDFYTVEEKPMFNGGDPRTEFPKYVAARIIYPQEAIDHGIEGRVTFLFIIDTDGQIKNIQVIGTADKVLAEEALRVIKTSPLWTPGKQRTTKVPVRFYFPVYFKFN